MAFKKHQPKFRRTREKLTRNVCAYCDIGYPIAEMQPDFGAHFEDRSLPFRVSVGVGGMYEGAIRIKYTVPYKSFHIRTLSVDDLSFLKHGGLCELPTDTRVIEPQQQQFAFPIKYCPMCGRKFKNSRSKIWRKRR